MNLKHAGLTALVILSVRSGSAQTVSLVKAFPQLTFNTPVFLTHAGDGTNRIFVVQQDGNILVFPDDSSVAAARTFLHITPKLSAVSGEEGLLGLAFHPQYGTNGYFYVNYTAPNPLRTVVARYRVLSGDPDRADSTSEFKIIEINQPFTNHNGGMLSFGPDGYLYMGMGDGGSGNDPLGNGQSMTTLLGKMLRIDVNDTTASLHYRIPPDNPFAGNSSGWREEIWALGMRNPWRWSFDPPTGKLWAGDVGQDTREEVDIITKGGNYGWNIMEGTICRPPTTTCDTAGLTLPIKDYTHALGIAVTGGYVYRGSRVPFLCGRLHLRRLRERSDLDAQVRGRSRYGRLPFAAGAVCRVIVRHGPVGRALRRELQRPGADIQVPRERADIRRGPRHPSLRTLRSRRISRTRSTRRRRSATKHRGRGRVTLSVFDLLGRKVATLVDGMQEGGATRQPSMPRMSRAASIIYRLTTSRGSLVKYMTLVR